MLGQNGRVRPDHYLKSRVGVSDVCRTEAQGPKGSPCRPSGPARQTERWAADELGAGLAAPMNIRGRTPIQRPPRVAAPRRDPASAAIRAPTASGASGPICPVPPSSPPRRLYLRCAGPGAEWRQRLAQPAPRTSLAFHYLNCPMTSAAFWPPKPKLVDPLVVCRRSGALARQNPRAGKGRNQGRIYGNCGFRRVKCGKCGICKSGNAKLLQFFLGVPPEWGSEGSPASWLFIRIIPD
jgi:hypothetical protein